MGVPPTGEGALGVALERVSVGEVHPPQPGLDVDEAPGDVAQLDT
jgi:hypothetical protein